MSTIEKIDKISAQPCVKDVTKLGIIAGSGTIPFKLAQCCHNNGIKVVICALEGQADSSLIKDYNHFWGTIGGAGKIIKTLKNHDISNIVLVGAVKRPTLKELKPDMKTAQFFARIGVKALGDNNLLELLHKELNREGFTVHGAQEFMQDLLTPKGLIGRYKPSKSVLETLRDSFEISKKIGALDIGQSIIIQNGYVVGVEAAEGTDALIRRCKDYIRKGGGAILVKTCKPMQNKYLDLPTIGPDTVLAAAESGLEGIVIESGNSFLIDAEDVAQIANMHKMFVLGIDAEDYG